LTPSAVTRFDASLAELAQQFGTTDWDDEDVEDDDGYV